MMVLYLNSIDLKALEDELSVQIERSPQIFRGIPIVVDLSAIEAGNNIDLNWLKNLLTVRHLIPVGIRNANDSLREKAEQAGWAILSDNGGKSKVRESTPSTEVSQTSTATVTPDESAATEMISAVGVSSSLETTVHIQQVRSGQQLSVPKGDLIVVNSVNEGSELLVDGNIHVYGVLRGRALAGIHGNQNVRIFCQSLEAELLSIAGFYKMQEDIPQELWGKSVQIYLQGEELKIEQLIK